MTSNSPKTSQILTRSASNSSAKLSKTPSSSSTPLSLEDFHKSINELRKTQDETLSQCKLLCQSQNHKFAELKAALEVLTSQVADLKSENTVLKNNIADLTKRVSAIETDKSSPHSDADSVQVILQEISERERCSHNVIVRGIPESSSSSSSDRISSDSMRLSEILQPFLPACPSNIKSIRLGRPNDRGPRPLKVFLSSKEQAIKLISDFYTNKRNHPTNDPLNSISVTRDRTPRERASIRQIYNNFENRKQNGETNITIKYKDGFPTIVLASRSTYVGNTSLAQPKN